MSNKKENLIKIKDNLFILKERNFENLINLKTLIINSNTLSIIENNAFFNLKILEFLKIANSQVSVFTKETFNGLNNLKILTLANNNIKDIRLSDLELKTVTYFNFIEKFENDQL